MSYHSESALKSINKRRYIFQIAQIEPILQKSKDTKIDNILNLGQVYFLVTHLCFIEYTSMSAIESFIPTIQITWAQRKYSDAMIF